LLGVAVRTFEQGGAEIVEIAPDGAADLAGLDVIDSADGKRVRSTSALAVDKNFLLRGRNMTRCSTLPPKLMFFLATLAVAMLPAAQAATHTYQGTAANGQFVRSGQLTLGKRSQTASPTQRKAKPHFTPGKQGAPSSNGGAPAASSLPTQSRISGSLLQNFNGLSNVDSANFNFGIVVEPPDQGLCVGNLAGQPAVFEMVNIVLAAYTPGGSTILFEDGVNDFFAEPQPAFTGELVSDPRCVYDRATNTFFFTVVATNFLASPPPATFESHLDVVVLNAATLSLTEYKFDTTDINNPLGDCPCLDDQPHLGIDNNALYVGADEFSLVAPPFNGAELLVISKSQLESGAASVNFAYFTNLSLAGIPVITLMPAISVTPTNTEYLENAFPYDALGNNITVTNEIGLWTSTNDAVVSSGGVPTLTATLVTTEPYAFPVLAETPPPTPDCILADEGAAFLCGFLNPNDDRMGQVEFINGQLWSAVETAVNLPGEVVQRDGAAWFKINASNGKVTQQGYVASAGQYLLYPTVLTTGTGLTTVNFTITNTSLNPSAAFTVFPTSPQPRITIAAQGVSPYNSFAFRWGDYSAAALDPGGRHIWMANEYIPPLADQVFFGTLPVANWGTEVFEH
jgi:hypothetical protein